MRGGERGELGVEGGELAERVADAAEFAGVAEAVLEAAEDARDVADLGEEIAEREETRGLLAEFADDGLAAVELGEIERGRGEPAFEKAGAGGSGSAVDGGEERALAGAARGLKDFEISERGGIEEERAGAAVFLKVAEVFRFGAEIFGRVVNERAGGAEGGVGVREAETLEVKDAERIHHGFRAGGGLEVIAGEFGDQARRTEGAERVDGGLVVRGSAPFFEFALDEEKFGRIERGEDGKEVRDLRISRDFEFAGGKIEPGGVEAVFVESNGAKVVIARGVELVGGEGCPRRKDTRELAADEFAGFGGFGLVADRDLFAHGEKFGNVGVGGVGREAGHGMVLTFGQGKPEQAGGDDGVVEEKFEEVPEAEEQQGIAREATLHLEVLLHHRGEFRGIGRHGSGRPSEITKRQKYTIKFVPLRGGADARPVAGCSFECGPRFTMRFPAKSRGGAPEVRPLSGSWAISYFAGLDAVSRRAHARMKFVIFGLTISSSWGNGHATLWRGLGRALAQRGHKIVFFEREVPHHAAHRDLTEWPDGELRLYEDFNKVRYLARRHLAEADVAMVTSGCPDALAAIELVLESRAQLRTFYDLDPAVTLGGSEFDQPVSYLGARGLGDFDLVLSYTGGRALEELQRKLKARRVAALYGSVDPEAHRRVPADEKFAADLSYLGTYAADRQRALEELFVETARRCGGKKFLIGGAEYPPDLPWLDNIYFAQQVEPGQHPTFYSSSRLTLNITRKAMKERGYCPSRRLFEAAAWGVPILSDRWEGLELFFEPGQEIVVAQSTDDAVAAMELSDEQLGKIAHAARERVLDEHTAAHRARHLEAIIENTQRAPEEAELARIRAQLPVRGAGDLVEA